MAERLSVKNLHATKLKINELFATWLATSDAQVTLDVIVGEALAAAKPIGATHDSDDGAGHVDPMSLDGVTPPRSRRATDDASRPGLNTRFLGVDEFDLHRATSPGASSPVSPATGLTGRGGVDPNLPMSSPARAAPRSPENRPAAIGALSQPYGFATSPRSASPVGSAKTNASFGTAANGTAFASFDDIPVFYHNTQAAGHLRPNPERTQNELDSLVAAFSSPKRPATGVRRTSDGETSRTFKRAQIGPLCADVFGVPAWMRGAVFKRILDTSSLPDNGPSTVITYADTKKFYETAWHKLSPNRRIFELVRGNAALNYVTIEDLVVVVRLLVDAHPSLSFLTQPEFQELYCKTVAIRIAYANEQHQSRRITWHDFDRCDVPQLMRALDTVSDINQVLTYFSYEHFYVLYCRFWELDGDRDHFVSMVDLQKYGQGSVGTRVLQRIVDGHGRKLTSNKPAHLDFEDFVYFCLSEEDKNSVPAKRYWFSVLDVDGDGVVSGHDMQYFFEEQVARLEQLSPNDEIQYHDMLCQMLDMLCPDLPCKLGVRLADLKRCASVENFVNMLSNAAKFLQFEHRDPFMEHQMRNMAEKTSWERFARAEYDRLAQEAT
jgi:Ca2+-binding EF-hand superfamily protein